MQNHPKSETTGLGTQRGRDLRILARKLSSEFRHSDKVLDPYPTEILNVLISPTTMTSPPTFKLEMDRIKTNDKFESPSDAPVLYIQLTPVPFPFVMFKHQLLDLRRSLIRHVQIIHSRIIDNGSRT